LCHGRVGPLITPVDFSDCSLTALQDAFSLAEESGAARTLLHVLEWPWEEPPPPRLEEMPLEQAAALAEYRRYCETTATARLESLVRGRKPLDVTVFGSMTSQLVRRATCPVLTLRR